VRILLRIFLIALPIFIILNWVSRGTLGGWELIYRGVSDICNATTVAAFIWLFIEAKEVGQFKGRIKSSYIRSTTANKLESWNRIKNNPQKIKAEVGTLRSLIKGFKEIDSTAYAEFLKLVNTIGASSDNNEIKDTFNELINDLRTNLSKDSA